MHQMKGVSCKLQPNNDLLCICVYVQNEAT